MIRIHGAFHLLASGIRVLSRRHARILVYHSIADFPADEWAVSPAQLDGHLRILHERGFQLCALPGLVTLLENGMDMSNRVCLTFDDGFADFKDTALPILRTWNAPATVFVALGEVGGRSDWSQASPNRVLMTWDDLEAILRAGVTVGSHSLSHHRLTELPASILQTEIEESRDLLRERLGIRDFHFAYPYGACTERERVAVRAAGYRSGALFGGLWGNAPGRDRWALTREPILGCDRLSDFVSMLEGWRDWKELWRSVVCNPIPTFT